MPPFVQLGTEIDQRFGGGQPGFLGLEHGAFEMPADPNDAKFTVRDITPPPGVDMQRISRRRKMLGTIDALQRTDRRAAGRVRRARRTLQSRAQHDHRAGNAKGLPHRRRNRQAPRRLRPQRVRPAAAAARGA